MQVKIIGHSSVIFNLSIDVSILCDPWFEGRVFNNGWEQSPPCLVDEDDIQKISHIYISHEHPDHLHFPTLNKFNIQTKNNIIVLIQKNHSNRVFEAIQKLGFKKIIALNHLEPYKINDDNDIHLYNYGHMDSALIIKSSGKMYINLNDAELNFTDCVKLRKKFGNFELMLSQFSIAGTDGVESNLDKDKKVILDKIKDQACGLKVNTVIPIASFIKFCMPDNIYLNEFRTTCIETKIFLQQNNIKCHLLYPGSFYDHSNNNDDQVKFENFYKNENINSEYELENPVQYEELKLIIIKRIENWKVNYPEFIFQKIGTLVFFIPDLKLKISINFQSCEVNISESEHFFMVINSQPLKFAFLYTYGIQTLGVSGRYKIVTQEKGWKIIRILSSLNNAEIHFTLKSCFSLNFIRWVWSRRINLFKNMKEQYRRVMQ